jgi:flagellar operon protein
MIQTQRIGAGQGIAPAQPAPRTGAANGFQQVLDRTLNGPDAISFSRHAEERMRARNLAVTDEVRGRLAQAVDRASDKGAREALVLLDQQAFVVNVQSRTVLTAMSQEQARSGVFTRIDSAVLA